jgi:hypothetical protein
MGDQAKTRSRTDDGQAPQRELTEEEKLIAEWCEAARVIVAERRSVWPSGRLLAEELLSAQGVEAARGGPVAENTVLNWCRGTARPMLRTALAISRLTGLSLDRLAGLYGNPAVGPPPSQEALTVLDDLGEIEAKMQRMLSELRRDRATRPREARARPQARA